MRNIIHKIALTLLLFCSVSTWADAGKINVLILSGQNNHNWKKTTPVLQELLESDDRFVVTITESPQTMTAETLQGIDLILSNWNTYGKRATVFEWPEATKTAFVDFIKNGGGLTVVHAGGSSFFDWEEYHQIVGATWHDKVSGHGKPFEFEVKPILEHDITRNMKPYSVNTELWHRMKVNGEINVLATAFSIRSKQDELVAFTTEYGNGRCFNFVLGAFDRTMKSSPEFKTFLLRGSEWAATGTIDETRAPQW